MPYSFKIIIHEVKIQIQDPILISNPIIAVTFANYPKMLIQGKCPISNLEKQGNQQKAFGNGKSAILHLDQQRMSDILRDQPLELLFLNGQAITAGAQINMNHFIPDIDGELKFKRGNFHLLDHFGKPYGLADISIAIHDPEKIPQILKDQEEQQIKETKYKQQQEYIKSLKTQNDPEPIPDQIVYKKKETKPIENNQQKFNVTNQQNLQTQQQKEQSLNQVYGQKQKSNSLKRPISAIAQTNNNAQNIKIQANYQVPNKYQTQIKSNLKKTSKPSSQNKIFQIKEEKKQQQFVKQNSNSVIIPEPQEINDIPISQWANQLYCPPPMFLDKQVYVHKIYNSPEELIPQTIKTVKQQSIAIQTDFQIPQFLEYQQIQENVTPNERQKTLTITSDNYQEDFESFVQSQSNMNQSSQLKQSRTPRVQPMSQRRTQSIQEAVDEDMISDIYSEDFELASQSQTFKRSLSKKDEISESYIPDFESVSQSQQLRKK